MFGSTKRERGELFKCRISISSHSVGIVSDGSAKFSAYLIVKTSRNIATAKSCCEIKFDGSGLLRFLLNRPFFHFLREFRVQFCANQQSESGPVQPDHEGNACSQSSVSFVKVRKSPEIDA